MKAVLALLAVAGVLVVGLWAWVGVSQSYASLEGYRASQAQAQAEQAQAQALIAQEETAQAGVNLQLAQSWMILIAAAGCC
jgi:hypothetical protein